jgi:glutaredoxin
MKLRYKWFDLNKSEQKTEELMKEIEPYGGPRNIPIVLINGYYIGGIKEFQDLVDEGWLIPILEKCNL